MVITYPKCQDTTGRKLLCSHLEQSYLFTSSPQVVPSYNGCHCSNQFLHCFWTNWHQHPFTHCHWQVWICNHLWLCYSPGWGFGQATNKASRSMESTQAMPHQMLKQEWQESNSGHTYLEANKREWLAWWNGLHSGSSLPSTCWDKSEVLHWYLDLTQLWRTWWGDWRNSYSWLHLEPRTVAGGNQFSQWHTPWSW